MSLSTAASLDRDDSFSNELEHWMSRAPWLALSTAAHVLVVLLLMAIPWDLLSQRREVALVTQIETFEEALFDEPLPEEPPPIDDTQDVPEPELVDSNLPEAPIVADEPDDPSDGDPTQLADSPFDDRALGKELGIGGPPGGKYGLRDVGKGRRPPGGGGGTEVSLREGLAWLAAHQSPDGSWDCDGFAGNCGKLGATTCDDPGEATHDVGVTGLALLAFLGDGHTTREGRYREVVARGVKWLKDNQDPDTGLFGEKVGHAFLYDHAIATLAVCEAYYFSKSPLIKRTAQDAANYLSIARNPYSAWRYDVPPSGDNDTSVTGWCVFALKSAEEAGLQVDPQAFVGALSWFDEVTDPATGRCGYDSIGSASSRIERVNDHFPPDKGEAMTAVALLCRFFMGQDPNQTPILQKHADLLRTKLPKWDPDGLGIDAYYWYYGSYAMYQMGGSKYWETWNKAMKAAVVESQRKDGDARGSWDARPDAWGFAGGRVYTTALMTLNLEVYFRYSRVLGAR